MLLANVNHIRYNKVNDCKKREGLKVTGRALEGGVRSYEGLPPLDARMWDVTTLGRIETPLDSRGFVDLDALVEVGRKTVTSDYQWESPFNDVHHLQWPRLAYAGSAETGLAWDFRELARRKAFLPRQFHNWLHYITQPPPVPDEESMRFAVQAERTTRALAATAQLAVRLTRKKFIPEKRLRERLEQEFDHYTMYVENARLVPEEFQLLKLADVEVATIEEMLAMNKKFGKWALHIIPVRQREVLGVAA